METKLLHAVRGDKRKAKRIHAIGKSPGSISFSAFERFKITDGEIEGLEIVKECPTRWRQGKLLGRGIYGAVYEAVSDDNKKYVIKKINIDYTSFGEAREYISTDFVKEVYYNVRLSEFGVTPDVFDWGMCAEEPKYLYMVSAGVDETLSERLCQEGLTEKLVLNITQKIISMCQEGIDHNDLHTNNIMIDGNDEVYIIDFGEASDFDKSNWEYHAAAAWIDLFTSFNYKYFWDVATSKHAASVAPELAPAIYKQKPNLAPEESGRDFKRARALAQFVASLSFEDRLNLLI